MCIISLRRIVEHLVEAHGVGQELVKVVRVVTQAQRNGAHNLLSERHDLVQVVHACLAEVLPETLGPHIGTVGELARHDLGVVERQIARDVVALLEIWLGVGLDHLPVHHFVAPVVLVLDRIIRIEACGIRLGWPVLLAFALSSFIFSSKGRAKNSLAILNISFWRLSGMG